MNPFRWVINWLTARQDKQREELEEVVKEFKKEVEDFKTTVEELREKDKR